MSYPSTRHSLPRGCLPFLRWAGSKRIKAPVVASFWCSKFTRYVEPFAGSAAVFFFLQPQRALLADINAELMHAFTLVAADPEGISQILNRLGRGRDEYYRVRALNPDELTKVARAARFVYLNRFCFNGLYRTNTAGGFNVPYGAPKTDSVPTLEHLRECSILLQRATILHADFRETLGHVQAGDFVYLDPPYALSSRRMFVEYGSSPFTIRDLTELAQLLDSIDERGASFVISYADCREARQAFAKWNRRRIPTRRNVAGFSAARRNQYELYATNCTAFDSTNEAVQPA